MLVDMVRCSLWPRICRESVMWHVASVSSSDCLMWRLTDGKYNARPWNHTGAAHALSGAFRWYTAMGSGE